MLIRRREIKNKQQDLQSDSIYSEQEEREFIKKLGRGIWYETKTISLRYVLLKKYLMNFKIRTLPLNIQRTKIIFFIENEIKKCEQHNECNKNIQLESAYKYEGISTNKCRDCK